MCIYKGIKKGKEKNIYNYKKYLKTNYLCNIDTDSLYLTHSINYSLINKNNILISSMAQLVSAFGC